MRDRRRAKKRFFSGTRATAGEESSLARSVWPARSRRFKCPLRCEERENPSPLSHEPTPTTYQVKMPAILDSRPPRSAGCSPHQCGASASRGT